VYVAVSDTFHAILNKMSRAKNILNEHKDIVLAAINSTKQSIGLTNTLKIFRISRQKYDRWIKNKTCSSSFIGLCVKQHPLQLTAREVKKLKLFLFDFTYRNWSLNSTYLYGIRNQFFAFSLSTFYRYAQLLDFSTFTPKNRHKNHHIGLRAAFPNQYWHANVTIFKPLDHTKIYIYLLIDNFSRYILSWRASLKLCAQTRLETITEAYHTFILKKPSFPVDLVVDNGSENKYIPLHPTDELSLQKIIAQQDIIFSNSMIEAT